MSSSVEIKDDGCKSLYLDIKTSGVELEVWREDAEGTEFITIWFGLERKEDREEIQKLIFHLQHQLEIHERLGRE